MNLNEIKSGKNVGVVWLNKEWIWTRQSISTEINLNEIKSMEVDASGSS